MEEYSVDSKSAFMWIALSIFSSEHNSVLTELMAILNVDDVLKLTKLLGGKTVTFPTNKELRINILSALCAYYIVIEKYTWEMCEDKLKVTGYDMKSIKLSYEKWLSYCEDHKIDPHHFLENSIDINMEEKNHG